MSRYHLILMLALIAGCVHEKQTPAKSAPPANPLTVDSPPQRATESNTVGRRYPSTGVEMWDPMPTPNSPLLPPKVNNEIKRTDFQFHKGYTYIVWFSGEIEQGVMGYTGKCIEINQISSVTEEGKE